MPIRVAAKATPAIAGFVLLEKVAPGGERLGRVAGVMLVGWGAWMVAGVL